MVYWKLQILLGLTISLAQMDLVLGSLPPSA